MATPKPPVLVTPADAMITVDTSPVFRWQVPEGEEGARYDFLLEIAEDRDFTKNVRRFNSFESKEGFSFNTPREANSGEIVSFVLPEPLVT
jgi:hypothetical protein